jgi:hypothetical protein
MDASHPEILFMIHIAIVTAAPQETVRNAVIEPGTAALQSGVTLALSQLSHHIPTNTNFKLILTLGPLCRTFVLLPSWQEYQYHELLSCGR